MGRLPFNPDRVPGASSPPPAPAHPHAPERLTVSQLAALIDRAVRERVPGGIRVVGEIGQFRERTHWYFDLKDADAVVSCVMWSSAARRAGFEPQSGMQVVITGHVEYYAKQGRTTFMADRIEPVGAGALELRLRQLVEELRGLGWLDDARKRPLPHFPRRVAVVTSRSGAALQDVLDTFRRRCPGLPVALVDVRVQGDGAADQVARAVRRIGRMHDQLGIDVVLITRGGGSMEDLWPFNDRGLAEAIVGCPVPVVAAIGHETDVTLAELVADVRAATPTQAAMRIAPDAQAIDRQLRSLGATLAFRAARVVQAERDEAASLSRHLRSGARLAVQGARTRMDRLAMRLERHRPSAIYARREARLGAMADRLREGMAALVEARSAEPAAQRLERAMQVALDRGESRLAAAARSLDLVGPPSVLQRGYSVTSRADGAIVRSVADVAAGEEVRTRVADGSFGSVVQGGPGSSRAARAVARAAVPMRRRGAGPKGQMGLFGSGPEGEGERAG